MDQQKTDKQLPGLQQPLLNVHSRKGRQDINKQSKNIIGNVFKFFKNFADNPKERENINFSQVMKLTANACGVSEKTVQRIKHTLKSVGSNEELQFESPRKRYKRESRKTQLNDFDKQVVRRTVFEYYDRGEFPTARKIMTELQQTINYTGSEDSVIRILKSLGFKYRKSNDGRKFLMERQDIAASRANFLRKMHLLRINDTRPIVYLDETWISQNHTKNYIWHDSKMNGGLKIPTDKGGPGRLIIVHAGSGVGGFIPEAKLLFWEGKKLQHCEYHTEMNGILFKQWFIDHLLCHLEEGSVIVMDNASYHSMLKDKVPKLNWEKNDIVQWLTLNNITHDPALTKSELLSMKEIKSAKKSYYIDHIANEMGHEVVRLPPYHCLYNPIELIWAQVKREVASNNNTCKLADVEKLTEEALNNVSSEDWANCVRQAEQLQEADYQQQCSRDDIIEPIVINLNDSSDDSSDEFENEICDDE